jgi:hypothetical protein
MFNEFNGILICGMMLGNRLRLVELRSMLLLLQDFRLMQFHFLQIHLHLHSAVDQPNQKIRRPG